jgi:hypothetical protein
MENQNKQNTALALRMQQANEIKQAVSCFIPEDEKGQELFSRNCLFYIVKNKAEIQGDMVIIPREKDTLEIGLFEFLEKMYVASSAGLSFINKEFTLVPFGGKNPTVAVVPDFRVEKRIAESKGLTIRFLHGRKGDAFTEEADPLCHTFTIIRRSGEFKIIEKTNQYGGLKSKNDVEWYAAIATAHATGKEYSYVESTNNILLRANPSTLSFYDNPNSMDSMYEKFVLRQLIRRLPSELRSIDFDKVEDIPYEEVIEEPAQIAPNTQPKQLPERPIEQNRLPLIKDSETWKKMVDAIKNKRVKDIASIERKYIIAANDREEILSMLMEQEQPATDGANEEKSPMNLFKE